MQVWPISNPSSGVGDRLVVPVVDDYGLETVQEYMWHIRNNAEMCVRNLLRDAVKRTGKSTLTAIDYLDDGSPVRTLSPCVLVKWTRHLGPTTDQIASRYRRKARICRAGFFWYRLRSAGESQRSDFRRARRSHLLHAIDDRC
jgi:hypothetical protein